jgi:hypothetical protein
MQRDTSNLLSLQNLMKRDPQSYEEEFNQQVIHPYTLTLYLTLPSSPHSHTYSILPYLPMRSSLVVDRFLLVLRSRNDSFVISIHHIKSLWYKVHYQLM